jgi:hypothetical protein
MANKESDGCPDKSPTDDSNRMTVIYKVLDFVDVPLENDVRK